MGRQKDTGAAIRILGNLGAKRAPLDSLGWHRNAWGYIGMLGEREFAIGTTRKAIGIPVAHYWGNNRNRNTL